MKHRILGLLAVGLLAGTLSAPANAIIVSGTWNFSAGSYSGSFSFTNLDTTQTYLNSTAAGFSITTSFDTSGLDNQFNFNAGDLRLGASGVNSVQVGPAVNDWHLLGINPFPGDTTGFFAYAPIIGDRVTSTAASITPAAVPEPGTLALLGLGLLGLGMTRRRAN